MHECAQTQTHSEAQIVDYRQGINTTAQEGSCTEKWPLHSPKFWTGLIPVPVPGVAQTISYIGLLELLEANSAAVVYREAPSFLAMPPMSAVRWWYRNFYTRTTPPEDPSTLEWPSWDIAAAPDWRIQAIHSQAPKFSLLLCVIWTSVNLTFFESQNTHQAKGGQSVAKYRM